jgi:hypothetical protein
MKYFLFFLLLLPSVTALAVTPTNLHFGSVERGEIITREVLVVNTLEQNIDVIISGVYSDEFNLGPLESRIIGVELEIFDLSDGRYIEELIIEEDFSSTVVNRISLPVKYHVLGGNFDFSALDLENIESGKKRSWLTYVLGTSVLGVGTLGYIRKKRKKLK